MVDFRVALPLSDIMLWSGLFLIACELVFSEFYFIWIGLGLLATYFTQLMISMPPVQNVMVMFVWIGIFIYIGVQFKQKHKTDENASRHLNQPKDHIVGCKAIFLQENHQKGTRYGYIELQGTTWQATLTESIKRQEGGKSYEVEVIAFEDMKVTVKLMDA